MLLPDDRRRTTDDGKASRLSAAGPPSSVGRNPSFAGLVALARRSDPIPSRTRPSNALAPMVLCLKTWESRSSPGLQRTDDNTKKRFLSTIPRRPKRRSPRIEQPKSPAHPSAGPKPAPSAPRQAPFAQNPAAGWSSPVARQAHNLKAAGSNPAPATRFYPLNQ